MKRTAHFLSGISSSSESFQAFVGDADPELGPFHPTNTFRSPFAISRSRISWYLKTVIELNGDGEFLINKETAKGADALISIDLEGADLLWRGDEDVMLDLASERVDFQAAIETPFGGNYFFQHPANRFFPICSLGDSSLVFRKPGATKTYAYVGVMTPGESEMLKVRKEFSPLPPVVSSAFLIPKIQRSDSGTFPIDLIPNGGVCGFELFGVSDDAKVTVAFTAPKEWKKRYGEDSVKILDTIPARAIGGTKDRREWNNAFIDKHSRTGFPPPFFGLDTSTAKCSGDLSLKFSIEPPTDFSVGVKIVRFLELDERPKWV